MKLTVYPWVFPLPRVYLHVVFCHESYNGFTVQLWVIVHDQKLQAIFFAPWQNFSLKNLPHNWIVHFFMLKMPPSNHFTSFVCSSFISTLVIVVSKFHLSLVIFVNFKSSVLWWFWPKVHHRKSAFFEMEKKIENRSEVAGTGRNCPGWLSDTTTETFDTFP